LFYFNLEVMQKPAAGEHPLPVLINPFCFI
jgi:hypothetical protein